MKIAYRCEINRCEDGLYLANFANIPEAITDGVTYEEALFNAEEVLTLSLEGRIEENAIVPFPDEAHQKDNEILVTPSPRVQTALLVRFSRADMTISDLARTLETSWPSVARLEDPHHWSSLRQLSKTASILGQKLVLSFEKTDIRILPK